MQDCASERGAMADVDDEVMLTWLDHSHTRAKHVQAAPERSDNDTADERAVMPAATVPCSSARTCTCVSLWRFHRCGRRAAMCVAREFGPAWMLACPIPASHD
jgi:hypothetical protein